MEAWQELARSTFDDTKFSDTQTHFTVTKICARPGLSTAYQNQKILAEDVTKFVTAPSRASNEVNTANATLHLVYIHRTDHEDIVCSPNMFHRLFESFRLDPAILYLISNNSNGFHQFQSTEGVSAPESAFTSFFVATVLYTLMWSFDPMTKSTKAIVLPRGTLGWQEVRATADGFGTVLSLYKHHVDRPYLLALVAAVHTTRYLDTRLAVELPFLRSVEAFTGYGAYIYDEPRPVLSLEGISRQAGRVGNSLVTIANHQRHIAIVRSLLSFLRECRTDNSGGLQPLLFVLEQQLQSTMALALYLGERARNQSNVLSNLLTHQDAIINTELAKSSREIAAAARKDGLTMREIATATRKDGEAMKTIAVMTMLFLPGTYFAALFAVPSLQWDKQPVIQTGFGTYWAFTLPTTTIIFVTWIFLTNWNGVCDLVVSRFSRNRKNTVEKDAEENHHAP